MIKLTSDTHIIINLREPYWDAWQKYGWEKDVEGLGVRDSLVKIADMAGKKILISFKYGDYEITPTKARKVADLYDSYFIARDGTKLMIIPRHKCKKISEGEENAKTKR